MKPSTNQLQPLVVVWITIRQVGILEGQSSLAVPKRNILSIWIGTHPDKCKDRCIRSYSGGNAHSDTTHVRTAEKSFSVQVAMTMLTPFSLIFNSSSRFNRLFLVSTIKTSSPCDWTDSKMRESASCPCCISTLKADVHFNSPVYFSKTKIS